MLRTGGASQLGILLCVWESQSMVELGDLFGVSGQQQVASYRGAGGTV